MEGAVYALKENKRTTIKKKTNKTKNRTTVNKRIKFDKNYGFFSLFYKMIERN